MIIWLAVFAALVFSLVVLFGAPYLPTMRRQSKEALDLLGLKPGQTLIELGCGDGRVVRSAAKRGLNVVGYEMNPFLVLICLIVTFRYRDKVRIVWGNYWRKDWPQADGIYVFLIDRFMTKLDRAMKSYPHKPIKLASYAFDIPGKKPVKTSKSMFLYLYK